MQKWIVHFKNKKKDITMSAEDLRMALKVGDVDPYDLVSSFGSKIKRRLIDVDEIFVDENVSTPGMMETVIAAIDKKDFEDDSENTIIALPSPISSELDEENEEITRLEVKNELLDNEQISEDISDIKTENQQELQPKLSVSANKVMINSKKMRIFYLQKNGSRRILGPHSPSEIKNMYLKGILSKHLMVLKKGSKKSIPLINFIGSYSMNPNKVKAGSFQGSYIQNRSNNKSGVFDFELTANMFYAIIAVMLTVLMYFMFIENNLATSNYKVLKRKYISGLLNKKPSYRVKKAKVKSKKASNKKYPYKNYIFKKPKKKRYFSGVSKSKSRKVYKYKSRKTSMSAKKYIKPRRIKRRKYIKPQKVIRRKNPALRKKNTVRRVRKGANIAALKPGMVNRLGPLTFNISNLTSCRTKCSISFRGSNGVILVKYFKAQWHSKLLAKRGTTYLSGLVKKTGRTYTLLLTKVN